MIRLWPRATVPAVPVWDAFDWFTANAAADDAVDTTILTDEHLADRAKLRRIGREYGRASATIHHLRGENALLREGHSQQAADLADERAINAELAQALDERRPAPDRTWLGQALRKRWYAISDQLTDDERWAQIADTATDAIRGLWPSPDHPTTTQAGCAAVVGEPEGGAAGERAPSGDTTDPADAAKVGDVLGRAWLSVQWGPGCSELHCTRQAGHAAQHVATGHDAYGFYVVKAVWPNDSAPQTQPCGGETRSSSSPERGPHHPAAPTDEQRDQLAAAIGRRDVELAGSNWAGMHDELRRYYVGRADDVIRAGWRPPVPPLDEARRADVASMLRAHLIELDGDDSTTCCCGWDGLELDHEDHVAEQLCASGVLR